MDVLLLWLFTSLITSQHAKFSLNQVKFSTKKKLCLNRKKLGIRCVSGCTFRVRVYLTTRMVGK